MLRAILQQSLHQNPKLHNKLQKLLKQSNLHKFSKINRNITSHLIYIQNHNNAVRSFSSCHVASFAKGRRPSPKDEASIFGEDASSGFGGAVPVEGRASPKMPDEPIDETTIQTGTTAENKEPQQQQQTKKPQQEDDDEDWDYEVVEDKNNNIPYSKIFTWLAALGTLGLLGYVAINFENLKERMESKWTEWRSPVTDVFLPAIPDNVPPEQRKPVLVLNVDDLLLHISYDGIQHGTRVQLRPFVGPFLEEMAKYYEIVLFADSSLQLLMETYQKLDNKYSFESHKLGSEYTTGYGRSIVKDLSRLGRPLSEVVFLEWRNDAFKFQPQNAITLPRWKGRTNDTTLRDLMPFLVALAQSKGNKDFRQILAEWGNKSDEGGRPAAAEHVIQQYNALVQQRTHQKEKETRGFFSRLFSWGN
mmetsp:Transcript_5573/g.20968  ORF Transcript_5573/g.20968 Transcript_5573/m.20968 type:complete len:418 (-) Transcript_5573:39-1292(-)